MGQFHDIINHSEIITQETFHSRTNPSIYATSTNAKNSRGGSRLHPGTNPGNGMGSSPTGRDPVIPAEPPATGSRRDPGPG